MRFILSLCILLSTLTCGYSSTIQGTIFYDDDFDGCRNTSEELSKEIKVTLYACDQNNQPSNVFVAETYSDEQGYYSFEGFNIADGTYYITVSTGNNHPTSKGSCDPQNDSDINGDGYSDCFDILEADTVTIDAGLIAKMYLGGRIFSDDNANGVFDAGEKNLGEIGKTVTLELLDENLNVLQVTGSDSRGSYGFTTKQGHYYIRFMPPVSAPVSSPGSSPSDADIFGDDDGAQEDTDGDGITDGFILSSLITLTRGQEPVNEPNQQYPPNDPNDNFTFDFGLLQCIPVIGNSFEDENKNGCIDIDEDSSVRTHEWKIYECDSELVTPSAYGTGKILDENSGRSIVFQNHCFTSDKLYYMEVTRAFDFDISTITSSTNCPEDLNSHFNNEGQTPCFNLYGDIAYNQIFLGYEPLPSSVTNSNLEEVLSIYPNPSSDLIEVDSELPILAISILDISGRSLINQKTRKQSSKVKLNLFHLTKGSYYVRVELSEGIAYRKLIKM